MHQGNCELLLKSVIIYIHCSPLGVVISFLYVMHAIRISPLKWGHLSTVCLKRFQVERLIRTYIKLWLLLVTVLRSFFNSSSKDNSTTTFSIHHWTSLSMPISSFITYFNLVQEKFLRNTYICHQNWYKPRFWISKWLKKLFKDLGA